MNVTWSKRRKATAMAIGAVFGSSLTLYGAPGASTAPETNGPAVPRMASGYTEAAVKGGPSVLNGVYRIAWTEQELIAAGASRAYAHGNQGITTLTLKDGRYRFHPGAPPDCNGKYTVIGVTFSINLNVSTCSGVVTATWSRLGNGDLRLHVTKATDHGDKFLFGGKPWKKIG